MGNTELLFNFNDKLLNAYTLDIHNNLTNVKYMTKKLQVGTAGFAHF
jgi:hypothetical protein